VKKLYYQYIWIAFITAFFIPGIVAAAPVVYMGSNRVIGIDGVKRKISVTMTLDDDFNHYAGAKPPGYNYHDVFGHFDIYTYLVEVEGLGVFAGSNGRLNIWVDQTPTNQTFYTEELEILENHGQMSFYDGMGNPYDWAPWMGGSPDYELPSELVIRVLNVTPGYSFTNSNSIHLKPQKCCQKCKQKFTGINDITRY
jgi:hypothetical protein